MLDSHDPDVPCADRMLSIFILTLKELPGVGPKTILRVLVNGREAIMGASLLDEDFARTLGDKTLDRALDRPGVSWNECEERAGEIMDRAERHGLSVLNPFMSAYPRRMLFNQSFPPLLFARGDVASLNAPAAVAMIGTRNPTNVAVRMGRRLAEILAGEGYVVVSGLALGCDTLGHQGALDAGGRTVAVLSTPVDGAVYPKCNQELAERIVENGGALVSEYAPGVPIPQRQFASNLVARDEWQPALADGVIAFETSTEGGTNHALRHALKTKTPVAVFDYSARHDVDFYGDPRFGGNVAYLESGNASPLYGPDTIEAFKMRMEQYRQTARNIHWSETSSNADSGSGTGFATPANASLEHVVVDQDGQMRFDFS